MPNRHDLSGRGHARHTRHLTVPLFRYKALTQSGTLIEGEQQALSAEAVIHRLHEMGHIPIEATPMGKGGSLLVLKNPMRPPSVAALAIMTHQWAAMLEARLPLDRSVKLLMGMTRNRMLNRSLSTVLRSIRGGSDLGQALEAEGRVFSSFYVGMMRAGEVNGNLSSALRLVADFLAKSASLHERVVSALLYPLLLLATSFGVVAFVTIVVLPTFAEMLVDMDAELPWTTVLLLSASGFMNKYWLFLIIMIAGSALALKLIWQMPRIQKLFHTRALRLPLIGKLIAIHESARFCRTLGAALAGGLSLPDGLQTASGVLFNQVFKDFIDKSAAAVREGAPLSHSLRDQIFLPAVAVDLIEMGEETGRLAELLTSAADLLEGELDRGVDRLMTLLVPATTAIVGGIIAIVVVSIFSALLSINTMVG